MSLKGKTPYSAFKELERRLALRLQKTFGRDLIREGYKAGTLNDIAKSKASTTTKE